MNVLVVGHGSIGKRHVDNLLKLDGVRHVTVWAGIRSREKRYLKDKRLDFVDSSVQSLIDVVTRGPEPFDFAVIANETYKHIDTAVLLAAKRIDLFIEKPLSHKLEEAEALLELAARRKVRVFVGYNLRFLGALNFIKQQLAERTIGELYFAKIEVGQYLPSWRPDRDYKASYSARKDHGGGVALDLSHEIDYMRFLFGNPDHWYRVRRKVSNLDIDSDDLFEGVYEYDSGFVCNTHMDYLQTDKKRGIRIIGSKGTIECDLVKQYIKIMVGENKEMTIEDQALFDVNETYISELASFINSVKESRDPLINLSDGLWALRLVESNSV